MAVLRRVVLALALIPSIGCQMSYYLHSAYHQTRLISSRVSVEKALSDDKLSAEQRRKLGLVREVKVFAENELGLAKSSNYTSFVQLNEPYVTYIVQAAYPFELKPYLWKFPFVGRVPYKGYFRRALADAEADELKARDFDTYVRGVSAYSTLGWFQDSVLSSMLRYDDFDLVELIIHETVHTTLFIKNAADFNERLATFLGREGMVLFYKGRPGGLGDEALKRVEGERADQKLFSEFLTTEVEALKAWYADPSRTVTAELKAARLKEIQDRFNAKLKPRFKTRLYDDFGRRELNNAVLIAYRTYEYSLADFEKLFSHLNRDFKATLSWLRNLAKEKSPEESLRAFVAKLPAKSPP